MNATSLKSRPAALVAGTRVRRGVRRRIWQLGLVLAALVACETALAALSADAAARMLAGLELTPAPGVQIPAARLREYAQAAQGRWEAYERRIGQPMQKWAQGALEPAPGATVFYPFSGPDFATVQRMHPDAARYVLVALQRAEPPPALDQASAADVAAFFQRFGEAWKQFAQIGFFRTLDLDEEAKQTGLRAGTTSPLLAFAVRSRFTVVSVDPVGVNAAGSDLEPHPGPRGESATWQSVRIVLERDGRKVLLDYVRANLSDNSLRARPEMKAWIERMAAHRTVLKAASHLPQDPRFTIVRDALLGHAPAIVQDETGIEYGALTRVFDVALYGHFTRPHNLFNQESQRALAQAYKTRTDVKPLPFRVSYQRLPEANLQVAVRRAPGAGAR